MSKRISRLHATMQYLETKLKIIFTTKMKRHERAHHQKIVTQCENQITQRFVLFLHIRQILCSIYRIFLTVIINDIAILNLSVKSHKRFLRISKQSCTYSKIKKSKSKLKKTITNGPHTQSSNNLKFLADS